MKKRLLSLRSQILITYIFIILLPFMILLIIYANNTMKSVRENYNIFLSQFNMQLSHNIDSILADADRMGYLHIVDPAIKKIFAKKYTTYSKEYLADNTTIASVITHAVKLNPDIVRVLYITKHGNVYDFNYNNYSELQKGIANVSAWLEIASRMPNKRYIAPIEVFEYPVKKGNYMIPVVKILVDTLNNEDLGSVCIGVNFEAVLNAIDINNLTQTGFFVCEQGNNIIYQTGKIPSNLDLNAFLTEAEKKIDFTSGPYDNGHYVDLNYKNMEYKLHWMQNKTTNWKIVHFVDNHSIASKYGQNMSPYYFILIIIISIALILGVLLSRVISDSIHKLCKAIDKTDTDHLETVSIPSIHSNSQARLLITTYNNMVKRLRQSIQKEYIYKINEKKMQLRMLEAQINPHFLYNTLNLIGSIANLNGIKTIQTLTYCISDIFRYSIKSGSIVTVENELEQVRNYIKIQQIRFPHRLDFHIRIQDEFLPVLIPKFIFQPLVENAVHHGIELSNHPGLLEITGYRENNTLHFIIKDNGVGISAEKLDKLRTLMNEGIDIAIDDRVRPSMGLANVHHRIQNFYGNTFGLEIESDLHCGTTVHILIPYNKMPDTMIQPS